MENHTRLSIRLGDDPEAKGAVVGVGLPVLAGEPCEALFPAARPAGRTSTFSLFRAGDWLLGGGAVAVGGNLEAVTMQLYHELIEAASGWHLCRVWNYVPAINGIGPNGLENYRTFSRGRSLAFERAAGPEFKHLLPAASAVGNSDERLVVVFAASSVGPLHRENPEQIPAYEYPAEHGPRAPSFARASIVPHSDGRRDVFISGTSAIKGHATIAPGDTLAQTRCTLDNVRMISRACGAGGKAGAGFPHSRHVKVYVRHATDQPAVARVLEEDFLRPRDVVTYLAADICRAALNVEIEVTILGASAV